jgi:hypothetical protein
MADITITFTVPVEQEARVLAAFARRFNKPDLTPAQLLNGLKAHFKDQIINVVVAEEKAAIEKQKDAITPPDIA